MYLGEKVKSELTPFGSFPLRENRKVSVAMEIKSVSSVSWGQGGKQSLPLYTNQGFKDRLGIPRTGGGTGVNS